MTESVLKRASRPAGGLGLLALILSGILYSAHSIMDWTVITALAVGAALLLFYLIFNYRGLLANWKLRSTQYSANTLATLLVVLAILGLINFLGAHHHKRFDLTTNKLFSLSPQTIKILKSLKNDIRVVYFDQSEGQSIRDLVREYMAQSPHLQYEFLDPQKNLQRARQYNVRTIPTLVVINDANPNQRQLVTDPSEENLTNAIVKLTHQKQKVIYFTVGHGEESTDATSAEGLSTAKKGLEDQGYEVKTLNLTQTKTVPEDCSVLVTAGPKYPFLPPEISAIDAYVDEGGKFLLLIDPETNPGFDSEFQKWKIQVDNDAVVDASGIGQILGMGPAAPIVTQYSDQPIVKDFNRTMTIFPLARSVRVGDNQSAFTATSLFKTSPNSWGETNLNERPLKFDKGKDLEGPLSLAVVSTKSVISTKDKPMRGNEARVEVIGNSHFAANDYFRMQRNGDLFLNSVSWLAEDEDLISIRPKNPENRSVEFTASTGQLLFWFIIIVLPAIALFSGILVWAKRRK